MRALFVFLGLSLAAACTATTPGPYTPAEQAGRRTVEAEELNRQAAELIHEEPERAESLLREALTADLYYGPAHNNLGVVYLEQGKLYEAAGEFEWARKLLPGHPDPRMNLALTLELAGQVDEALAAYETALEVSPEQIHTIQAMARLALMQRREDPRIPDWLDAIALRGATPDWKSWARTQSLKLPDIQ